jgi:periplasmic nitrate reductase NapD
MKNMIQAQKTMQPIEAIKAIGVPLPVDAGSEGNICGVLVHVHPEHLAQAMAALVELPGTEIHQSAPDGRIVVTVEDVPGKWAGNTLTDINNIEGVLSAALVFHHRDSDLDDEAMCDADEEGSQ